MKKRRRISWQNLMTLQLIFLILSFNKNEYKEDIKRDLDCK